MAYDACVVKPIRNKSKQNVAPPRVKYVASSVFLCSWDWTHAVLCFLRQLHGAECELGSMPVSSTTACSLSAQPSSSALECAHPFCGVRLTALSLFLVCSSRCGVCLPSFLSPSASAVVLSPFGSCWCQGGRYFYPLRNQSSFKQFTDPNCWNLWQHVILYDCFWYVCRTNLNF